MLAGRQLQTTGPIGMRPGRPRLLHRPDAISSSYTTLSFFFFLHNTVLRSIVVLDHSSKGGRRPLSLSPFQYIGQELSYS